MARLEDLTRGATVKGILPDTVVTVVDVKWYGSAVVDLTYRDAAGRFGSELIYRDREPTLELAATGAPWSFDGDGALLKLVSEAHRIRLAYLFDPLLAVHTSDVEPLPHQITAVYGEMLPRQPLRFLLADDPGAGKTIMAGLLVKELIARGDVRRCLICCPGNLAEQWQEELYRRFGLRFEIITHETIETSLTGNPYAEKSLVISRLDHMSRNESIIAKLEQTDWDLVVCDEAHKMSASYFGNEVKYTKRYRLGQLLSRLARHFLLMTATPHNGKEQDFQLFMALIDGDRFEGKYRDGVHHVDVTDLMRRLVKEKLVKFDGTPLFPERRAYSRNYALSSLEAKLYEQVTSYVRQEFNRADALGKEGRKGTVGFALTILQRRLASSPEAIYQSIRRRRERLYQKLQETKLLRRGAEIDLASNLPEITADDLEDFEDTPDDESAKIEEAIVDQASAAQTIAELEAEIETLRRLEDLASTVRRSGKDCKWEELSSLLQNTRDMFDAEGNRRKLIIFTEHRDTLNYLKERISDLLGLPEAVVVIHGGIGREERRTRQEAFTQDKMVQILVATDAAGEGINLQRAHLMINYDLPWNPNRLEQRFGRIHRIGQTEVCHLWNLVAGETREGEVYQRLFDKIEEEREALGGQVFDVLGKLRFENRPLHELLIEAIRYGDQPDVRQRLNRVVDITLDRQHLQDLIEERALVHDSMDISKVRKIREDMERAAARRLQPHFIRSFFIEAFRQLGGTIREREPGRFEVTHVPASIRSRDRMIGVGEPVLRSYERITFDKELRAIPGMPLAAFVCPGHPLLDATTDLALERYRELLKRGAVLVDPSDHEEEPRVLLYLEHSVQDARQDASGNKRLVSRQLQFVEIDRNGKVRHAGYAPYLDYGPLQAGETELLSSLLEESWLRSEIEERGISYAITSIVPVHLSEVRQRKEILVGKTVTAVKDRLTKEINYWDHRAEELKAQELAGKTPRLNSTRARQRADELAERLQKRLIELDQERHVSAQPPVVVGGAFVVPAGLIARLKGRGSCEHSLYAHQTQRVERLAMDAVVKAESTLGFEPLDVSSEKRGYDIESRDPNTGHLRFIEVKGRIEGANEVTITKNEILTALNKPDAFVLALVQVSQDDSTLTRYLRIPFQNEPDFGVTTVNFKWDVFWAKATDPN